MAKILYAWELGAGLGHMAPYRGIFEKLCAKGHSLTLVLRDLSRARSVFKGLNVALLQSPVKIGSAANPVPEEMTFAHLLHNVGYEEPNELETMVGAWRRIYELTRPDLVLADYSPTAMVAWRGQLFRKIIIGTGFTIPPDTFPFATIRPWQAFDEARAARDEGPLHARIDGVLSHFGQPTLTRIGQLFTDVDDRMLKSYPELDHYGARNDATYWGLREGFKGADFEWPAGSGPKIFAYIRTFAQIHVVLQVLKDLKYPTIIATDQISSDTQHAFTTEHLRFESRPLNLEKVCAECSLAIFNGSHNSVCKLLLAGKPVLNIPLTAEQAMFSVAVQRLGAGLLVSPERPAEFAGKLAAMLSTPSFAQAAQRFAARYAQNDPAALDDLLVARIEEILAPGWLQVPRKMPPPLKVQGEPLLNEPAPMPVAKSAEAPAAKAPYNVSMVHRDTLPPTAPAFPGEESIEAALVHHQNGRLEEAAKIYQAILRKAPNAAALHLLGVIHLQTRQFEKAVELIESAVAAAPNESSFRSNLGEAYRNLGQYDRAAECCLTALRLRPDYPEACNNLALVLQAQGKYAAAVVRFREAIQHNPRYVAAHNNLGTLLGEIGQFEEARACFARAKEASR